MKHKIKEMRKLKGLTQAQLAELLEISPQGVSKIECSDNVTINTLEKVATALGCYVHELIDSTETNTGLLAFDSPEAFDAYHASLLKNIDDLERSKLSILIENASMLNDTGIILLSAISNVLTTAEELVKPGIKNDINTAKELKDDDQ